MHGGILFRRFFSFQTAFDMLKYPVDVPVRRQHPERRDSPERSRTADQPSPAEPENGRGGA